MNKNNISKYLLKLYIGLLGENRTVILSNVRRRTSGDISYGIYLSGLIYPDNINYLFIYLD